MDQFKLNKVLLLIPLLMATSNLIGVLTNTFNLFIFDHSTLFLDILYLGMDLLLVSPSLVFAYIVISQSQSEVEQKMTLYGLGILILVLSYEVLAIYVILDLNIVSITFDQLYRIIRAFTIGISVLLFLLAIRLPGSSKDLRRHRIIAALYPFALIISQRLIDFVLDAAPPIQDFSIFISLLNLSYILSGLVLLFVLIDSTERVFSTEIVDAGEARMWPDTAK